MAKSNREMVLQRLNQAIERLNGAYGDTLAAARMFEAGTIVHDGIVQCANHIVRCCGALVSIRDAQRSNQNGG